MSCPQHWGANLSANWNRSANCLRKVAVVNSLSFFLSHYPPHPLYSSSNASPSEGAPALSGSYGCTPQSLPKFLHPSHELLRENGFTQQVYHKYRRRCLNGAMIVCFLHNSHSVHTLPLKSLGSVRFFYVFLKTFLLLMKAVSIWSKIKKKTYFVKYYCNLKITVFYFKI